MPEFLLSVKAVGTKALADDAKEAKQACDNMAGGARSISKSINGAVRELGNMAKAMAATAIVQWARTVITSAQALTDLSNVTGRSRTELQAWQHAANATGSSGEALNAAFERFAQLQGEIQSGVGRSAERLRAFEQLGITFDELNKKSPAQLFKELMERMQDGVITNEQFAAGVKLLGENFKEVAAAAKDGFAGMAEDFKGGWAEIDEGTMTVLDNMGQAFDETWANIKAGAKKFAADLIVTISDGVTALMNLPVKLVGLFNKDAAAIAEEVDTQLALNKMGGDGSQGVAQKEKELRDKEEQQAAQQKLKGMQDEIRTLAGDDADEILEDLADSSAGVSGYERTLKRLRRQKNKAEKDKQHDMTPSDEQERGHGAPTPGADALARIGLFRGGEGVVPIMQRQLQQQTKMAEGIKELNAAVREE